MQKEITYRDAQLLVSDDGTITWNNKIRNHFFDKDGYPRISFNTPKGWRTAAIHRLLAIAFIPNPNNYPEVDHIDFDRTNYKLNNLAWITRKENVKRSLVNRPDMTGENNPNYGNRKLSKFYKEHPEIAKEKQGRPGKQNGRYKHGRYMSEKV